MINDLHQLSDATTEKNRQRAWKLIDGRLEQLHRHLGLGVEMRTESTQPADPERIAMLRRLLDVYFPLQVALAHDDDAAAKKAAAEIEKTASHMPPYEKVKPLAHAMTEADDIKARRAAFEPLTKAISEAVSQDGHDQVGGVFVMHCPMAFGRGADWVQATRDVVNPYMGTAMFACGELRQTLSPPIVDAKKAPEHVHPKP
ncbi:MAG: DUF3347 domain-containing protein [Prosthecobacter sp.]